jgi:hypothetical protein
MDRFIAKQNVEHFRAQLRTETDLGVRSSLHYLLIAEEDKLGFDLEQIAAIEHEIAYWRKRTNHQQNGRRTFGR